ncbi:MAG: DUF4430 domain-containing protein [Oscillospiraceae bacterium]|nr:DUF4430 domain-containing protein [Oscillospiraceae bacterium]
MKHLLSKTLCILLAVVVLTGLCPAALAAEEEHDEDVPSLSAEAETGENGETAPSEENSGQTDASENESTSAFTGSGTEDDPFLLDTSEDLTVLSSLVNGGESFQGKVFRMTADVTLPSGWIPIGALVPGADTADSGRNIRPFAGTFDGQGHLLSVPAGGLPLFGYVRGAVVRNLSVFGERIEADGVVANYVTDYGSDGEYSGVAMTLISFENVTIKSGTQTLRSGFIGGMDHPEQTGEYGQASSQNEISFSDCTVESGVVIGYDRSQSGIGSFAGNFNGSVKGCVSSADVYGLDKVGGIVGEKSSSMGRCTVSDSEFHGTVTASGSWAGGIVGAGYDHETAPNAVCVCIQNCRCDGTVAAGRCAGGIFGGEGGLWQAWENGIAEIRSNSFTGLVSGEESIGAVIGYYRSLNRYTVIENNSYATGCGADKGIGTVLYVDSSIYADGKIRAVGWVNGVYCFDSSEDSMDRIKYDLNRSTAYYNIAKKDHNRTDDPLGADAEDLCYPVAPSEPDDPEQPPEPAERRPAKLTVSGEYRTKYTVGDVLDTKGMIFTVTWSDGSETRADTSDITFAGFDSSKAGSCTVTARFDAVSTFFTVTIEPRSERIRVTVAVYGDRRHDSDADGNRHGLAMGGLTTWVAPSSWNADATETVWDVLQRVFAARGITARVSTGSGSVYVAGLTFGGISLSEFDNGVNSGWMYTVNGVHPQLGVSQKYVKDGDSIVLHYSDDYTKEQGSEGYDDDTADRSVENVVALIRAIGAPVTETSRTAVEKARKAYDALTYAQKSKVTNYAILTAAEKTLEELKTAADAKEAQKVKDRIDRLPSQITEKDRTAVEEARSAYEALTENQKKLVTNYAVLTAAERTLAEAEATEKDREAAKKVKTMIEAIGRTVPEGMEKAVADARNAYDALTDLQKKLVDNYEQLVRAEQMLEVLKTAEKYRNIYETTGDYIESLGTPVTGAIGGEWTIIGLIRSGREPKGLEEYLAGAEQYVAENADEHGRLHRAKSSDNSRMILALTALGLDVADFGGHNLLAGLTDMEYVSRQGINGPSWALIALDCGAYEVPEDTSAEDPVTREKLIACLLKAQLQDGGWALSGSVSDSDMTGMVLQALAPYYGRLPEVTKAVDLALDTVSRMQNEDGTFSAFGGDGSMVATSESLSQILTALSALGIDAGHDERFIRNGKSVLDALCSFYVEGGGFRHVIDGERDGMATEQAYYALTAYFRMLEGKTALYDMTDALPERGTSAAEAPEKGTYEPTDNVTEEGTYEEIAVASDAAAKSEGMKGPTFLIWGIPAVAVVGAAAYLIDRKRRAGGR